ncbi:MAG: JAB domain-containing protein [Bacteroidota bacterium]
MANSEDVFRIMQKILMRQNRLHRKKEYFWTLGLNGVHDIEYIELICIGTLNKVVIAPVDVFNFAVSKKCKTIILCHNHPSGELEASPEDLSLTQTLKNGAKYLNIFILDHIIITEDDYMSFADKDLM